MSRIGRSPIPLPPAVKVKPEGSSLFVEGPKGKLSLVLPAAISVHMNGQQLEVRCANEEQSVRALHGLYRALIANMVQGVVGGFSKELEIVGIGYRAQIQGRQLSLHVGFSHPVLVQLPDGITIELKIIRLNGREKKLFEESLKYHFHTRHFLEVTDGGEKR